MDTLSLKGRGLGMLESSVAVRAGFLVPRLHACVSASTVTVTVEYPVSKGYDAVVAVVPQGDGFRETGVGFSLGLALVRGLGSGGRSLDGNSRLVI